MCPSILPKTTERNCFISTKPYIPLIKQLHTGHCGIGSSAPCPFIEGVADASGTMEGVFLEGVCRHLERRKPGDGIIATVVNAPMIVRPVFLAHFLHAQNPPIIPLLRELLCLHACGL